MFAIQKYETRWPRVGSPRAAGALATRFQRLRSNETNAFASSIRDFEEEALSILKAASIDPPDSRLPMLWVDYAALVIQMSAQVHALLDEGNSARAAMWALNLGELVAEWRFRAGWGPLARHAKPMRTGRKRGSKGAAAKMFASLVNSNPGVKGPNLWNALKKRDGVKVIRAARPENEAVLIDRRARPWSRRAFLVEISKIKKRLRKA